MIDALARLIQVIGNISNTTWGILILLFSMWIAVHYNRDIGFYFAGVGSTLAGINSMKQLSHDTSNNKTTTTTIQD